jgi:protein involved in polysaccharide export with SLBB domain
METITNQPPQDLLKAPPETFRLGPGDKVELELIGDTFSRTLTTVGPDGKVYFHLLPGTDVWGLTLGEAKTKLQKEMQDYIKDNPQISLTLRGVESKRVWLLGRFQSPGVYPMPAPMTVLEAITLAGGPISLSANAQSGFAYNSEDMADLKRAFLIRKGQRVPIDFEALLKRGDLSQNIFLQPDDFLYFPTLALRQVYVLGAVARPQAVPYNTSLTLAGAVAYANGTIKDAYLLNTALVRGSMTKPQIAIVNLKGILTGQMPDVQLQPEDIVYVPFSPYRYLAKYANLVLDTFVSTVAINEGARAAVHSPATTSVFIPLGVSPTITTTPASGK